MLAKVSQTGFAAVKHPDHVSLATTIGKPAYAALAISGIENPEDQKKFEVLLKEAVSKINNPL
jgi:hypothetical protein